MIKKIKKIVFVITAVVFSIIFYACKKERILTPPKDCSITMANIAGKYKFKSIVYKANATAPVQDFMALNGACENDNELELRVNGTFAYNDLGIICSPNGSYTGTWGLAGNTLTSSDANLMSGNVESFDCQNFVYFIKDVIITGDKITVTLMK